MEIKLASKPAANDGLDNPYFRRIHFENLGHFSLVKKGNLGRTMQRQLAIYRRVICRNIAWRHTGMGNLRQNILPGNNAGAFLFFRFQIAMLIMKRFRNVFIAVSLFAEFVNPGSIVF
jgi:hypothetical protein